VVDYIGEFWFRREMKEAAQYTVEYAKSAWEEQNLDSVDDITLVLASLREPAE
jgi:hypothetical protein